MGFLIKLYMFNQKRRNRFGGFPLFRASGYRSQCGLKRPSPPLSAQYSRAMRQHGLFALLATGGAISFQTSPNQIMRLLSVMARQRTNEGLRLRRTITKPEPEKPMIWRIVPGILTPVHLSADLREPRVPLRILRSVVEYVVAPRFMCGV